MAMGAALGSVLLFTVWRPLQPTEWIALHIALVAPTAFQPWLQYKAYKVMARTFLGFATATWWWGVVGVGVAWEMPIVGGVAAALWFLFTHRMLSMVRQQFTANPCTDCPLGAYPTCAWNVQHMTGVDGALKAAITDIEARNAWDEDVLMRTETLQSDMAGNEGPKST